MPKIIKTTNTKGGTNKSRYRGGEERWGEGGGEIFAYKNQHIFGARTICTSKRERERRSTWASALHCNCRRSEESEERGEQRMGGGEEKPTT